MPIITAQGNVMPGPYPGPYTAALHDAAVDVVNELTYVVGLWGNRGTLVPGGPNGCRLDLQGYTGAGQMNLQVQVNGMRNRDPSTIATVLVDPTAQAIAAPGPRRDAQMIEITRKVKGALMRSLYEFEQHQPCIWLVQGAPSS